MQAVEHEHAWNTRGSILSLESMGKAKNFQTAVISAYNCKTPQQNCCCLKAELKAELGGPVKSHRVRSTDSMPDPHPKIPAVSQLQEDIDPHGIRWSRRIIFLLLLFFSVADSGSLLQLELSLTSNNPKP